MDKNGYNSNCPLPYPPCEESNFPVSSCLPGVIIGAPPSSNPKVTADLSTNLEKAGKEKKIMCFLIELRG